MNEGYKDDSRKIRLDLIPPEFLMEVGKVLTYGAYKYGDRNWEQGIHYSRIYGAILRHLLAWWKGERLDESGYSHLSHAACNIAFLLWYERHKKEFDDRPTTVRQRKTNKCPKSLGDFSSSLEPHDSDNGLSGINEEREVIAVSKDYSGK